jgi:hypothetical protein
MNPQLLSQIARQHVTDLRDSAATRRAGTAASQQRADGRPTIRSRTGWKLVQIGLRLATSAGA